MSNIKSSSEEVRFCQGSKLGPTGLERAFQREGAAMEKAVSLQDWAPDLRVEGSCGCGWEWSGGAVK